MIPRYSRPQMANIWSDESRFSIWLEIEILSVEGWEKLGRVPDGTAVQIRKIIAEREANDLTAFSVDRVLEIEKEVKHDVIAFLTCVNENIGEIGRFMHLGMTSSDVLDTALAVQLCRAADLLLDDLDRLKTALKKRAREHQYTVQIGRSHGIHAEPITFGLKLAGWYAETERNRRRLLAARDDIATGKISGAVGTYAHLEPEVETHVLDALGLRPETIATQVVQRDRHAHFFTTLGIIASSLERFAVEIRHLQRSEVLEAQEAFGKGQKGSSAMPHKRNPILSENLTGLARIVRAAVVPALENVALWHERDISHSSVERMIGPDATVTLDFALNRMVGLIDGLLVLPDNMARNVDLLRGIIHSQRILLALVDTGMTREEAYALVQECARGVWDEGKHFREQITSHPVISECLDAQVIDDIFASKRDLKHVDFMMDRALGKEETKV